jgi:hypothetical protein
MEMQINDEITSLCANNQAMGLPQFLEQANPMMSAVDDAMVRMFGNSQTEEERRADLERKEDEFMARAESMRQQTFGNAVV